VTAPSPQLDPLYVAARRVLLDALDALVNHRDATVLAGAQAVYVRTGAVRTSHTISPVAGLAPCLGYRSGYALQEAGVPIAYSPARG
jgi:hypothetical protein